MHDELINALRRLSDWSIMDFEDNLSYANQIAKEAADAIEELMAERDEVNADSWKRAFEVERDERRWIPVTERLPSREGRYITAFSKGKVGENVFMIFPDAPAKWYYNSEDTGEVTHWKPLPEPPKEE